MEERLTGDRRQSSEIKQLFLILSLKSLPLLHPEFTSISFLAPSRPFWGDCHSFLVTIKQTAQQEGLTTHPQCVSVFRLGYKWKRHREPMLATVFNKDWFCVLIYLSIYILFIKSPLIHLGSRDLMVERQTHNRKVASLSLGPAGIVGGGSECTALSPRLRCPWARHRTSNCSPGTVA